MSGDLDIEVAKLREQVEALTEALAEALAIIARASPGGMGDLRKFLETRP